MLFGTTHMVTTELVETLSHKYIASMLTFHKHTSIKLLNFTYISIFTLFLQHMQDNLCEYFNFKILYIQIKKTLPN